MRKQTATKPKRECRYLIRFEATASDIRQMRKQLEAIAPSLAARISKIDSGMSRADRLHDAVLMLQDAMGEVESLKEEIESWHDNLPESFQNGDKGSDLQECLSTLDAMRDSLDSAITDGEQVSFPGMY